MEPSTALPDLSRFENIGGWEPNPNCKLRRGQSDLLTAVKMNPAKRQYNAFLPTGYGKTICSILTYGSLRGSGRVNRAIVVVPSVQQMTDYCEDLGKVCQYLGLDICGYDQCGEPRALRLSRLGKAEIFVTTIQAIYADFEAQGKRNINNGYYANLMGEGKWLVVADEHHHYRENKAWGEALNSLRFDVRLGLSATPLSSRGEPSVVGVDYDVIVSISEAYEEEAIRRFRGHIMEHHVDLMLGDDDEIIRMTTTEIGEDMMPNESVNSWEVRKKVRYCSDYLSHTMGAATAALNRKLLKHSGQHQMLVFAMSCRHARHVSDMLNATYGGGETKFSDWIGTGPNGRPENENYDILKRYKENDIKCLVQVNKAGEGFDNSRSSILVFINDGTSKSNNSKQQFGRGFRRNKEISKFKDDVCDIFVSSDSDLVSLVRNLELETRVRDPDGHDDDDFDGGDDIDRLYDIPDLVYVIRTELSHTETIEPLGTPSEAARRLKELDEFRYEDDERLEAAIRRVMYAKKEEIRQQSEADMLDHVRTQVRTATDGLSYQAAKIFYGKTIPKDGVGKMARKINSKWKSENLSHGEMTRAEFSRKYKWLQHINNTIKAQRSLDSFPWLML